jgi:hypothetical protein
MHQAGDGIKLDPLILTENSVTRVVAKIPMLKVLCIRIQGPKNHNEERQKKADRVQPKPIGQDDPAEQDKHGDQLTKKNYPH